MLCAWVSNFSFNFNFTQILAKTLCRSRTKTPPMTSWNITLSSNSFFWKLDGESKLKRCEGVDNLNPWISLFSLPKSRSGVFWSLTVQCFLEEHRQPSLRMMWPTDTLVPDSLWSGDTVFFIRVLCIFSVLISITLFTDFCFICA